MKIFPLISATLLLSAVAACAPRDDRPPAADAGTTTSTTPAPTTTTTTTSSTSGEPAPTPIEPAVEAPAADPPRVVQLTPIAGAQLDVAPATIAVTFDAPLDPARALSFVVAGGAQLRSGAATIDGVRAQLTLIDALAPGFYDVALRDGDLLLASWWFEVEAPPPPPPPPLSLLSASPDDGTLTALEGAEIVLRFSAPIDGEHLYALHGSASPARDSWHSNDGLRFSVVNDELHAKLAGPLDEGANYTWRIAGEVRDTAGARLQIEETGTFATGGPADSIDVGFVVEHAAYDPARHAVVAVSRAAKKIAVIDLATGAVVKSRVLPTRPDDACFSPDGTAIYVVNASSTFVTKLARDSLEQTATLPWPAPSERDEGIFQIECLKDGLVVTDAGYEPGAWRIGTAAPHVVVDLRAVAKGIGDLVFTADEQHAYAWSQHGWSAGMSQSNVRRFDIGAGAWALGDQSRDPNSGSSYDRDPLDAPIFVDEANNRVYAKRAVLHADDLRQLDYELPEPIFAADFARGRVAGRAHVYELSLFEPIAAISVESERPMFFDRDGALRFFSKSGRWLQQRALP